MPVQISLRVMTKISKHRVIVAWILLLSLLPFYAIKTVHVHEIDKEEQCAHTGHHHNSNNCAICQFVLSPCTEGSPIVFHPEYSFIISLQVAIHESPIIRSIRSYSLRSPPFC